MKHIHFIINPIAGSGNHKINKTFLETYFEKSKYQIKVKFSNFKKHTRQLTQESIKQNAHIIVACGGDGTINEVASNIINTSIVLGIIPLGSGNGLASHLNISKNIYNAIKTIKKHEIKTIDIGRLNNHYFFSNAGMGFNAHVIKHYEESNNRKLLSYIKSVLKAFKDRHNPHEIEVKIDRESFTSNPFMIFVSNSNELGYNISLTPKASLEDGLLDLLIVSKLNVFKIIFFSFLMIFKKHHLLKEVKGFQAKNIRLSQKNNNHFKLQIDGEFRVIQNDQINISISEKALKIIA